MTADGDGGLLLRCGLVENIQYVELQIVVKI